ncbi:hypothetical protein F4V57_00040 [Acinetobacter qingfengensis]|uniref:HTH cro/C1-type domain-containing protein n=2 Tax=Acinetobacter qingfengensis TaxID=1262585 RepID=A0A1E7R5M5_9GAMM|nr:hypothetical protein F4V57_00040 [Acinetobacter qingfengensis]OEY94628.1 hypothetical protein BJI46_13470 [Acinetobacter qingfengensis]
MKVKNEKEAFSKRLKQQLAKNGWAINSPTWLAREFNLRYQGQPVSVQTASNWLSGNAIPNQDKLQILAVWLDISSQWLRFGEELNDQQESTNTDYHTNITLSDFSDKFAKLTTKQKSLIYHLIEEMLSANK